MAGLATSSQLSQLIRNAANRDPDITTDSASQPISDAFRRRAVSSRLVLTGQQRPNGLPIKFDMKALKDVNHTHLREQVFWELKSRLLDASINISDMDKLLFAFMLPGNHANPQDWHDLINNPLILSPDRVRTMFSMTPSGPHDLKSPDENMYFYCRTFTFTLTEFVDLYQALLDENIEPVSIQLHAWKSQIETMDPETEGDTPIYVRYIGLTTRTPWSRYKTDLSTSTKVAGLHRRFMELCSARFQEVLAAADIEYFDLGTIEMDMVCSKQRIADVREQGLTALFGRNVLLNSSVGGLSAIALFDEKDSQEFLVFRTRTIKRLEQHATPLSDLSELHQYGRDIQQYTSRNPESTGSIERPINDDIRDMLVQAAVPAMIKGHAVLVTIGSDLAPSAYDEKRPFTSGYARSGALTMDHFNNIVHLEIGFTATAQYQATNLQRQGFFPFVDLFPWTRKDLQNDMNGAMRLLRQYLAATSPMILLTFSETVSGVALGKFQHAKGIPSGQTMVMISGKPYLSKFDHSASEKEDDCCCIVVPCIHPGTMAHSGDQPVYQRLFTKSLMVAWLAASLASEELIEGSKSKREICKTILKAMHPIVGPDTPFGRSLEQVRKDIRTEAVAKANRQRDQVELSRNRQNERSQAFAVENNQEDYLSATATKPKLKITWTGSTPEIDASAARCRKALQELYFIIDCDIARTGPNTTERADQIARLVGAFSKQLAPDNNSRLLAGKLKNVKVGQSFYLGVTESKHHAADLSHLLPFFADDQESGPPSEWMDDMDKVSKATQKLTKFISENVITKNLQRQDTISKVGHSFRRFLEANHPKLAFYMSKLSLLERVAVTTFTKSPHKIKMRASHNQAWIVLKWSYGGTEYTMDKFLVPYSAFPIVPGEDRFLSFVKEGINIQDSAGRVLGAANLVQATIPIHHLVTRLSDSDLRQEFFDLWERETGTTVSETLHQGPANVLLGNTTRSITAYAYPKTFYQGKGHGLPISLTGRTEALKVANLRKDQFPFKPADVGWFIHKLLQAKYPNGGEVELCSPDVWPESPSFWTDLRAFVEEPLYTNLPYRDTLIAACDGIKNVGRAGQGAGKKDAGHQLIRAVSRLVHAIRDPFSEKPVEKKNKKLRRTKTVLTIGTNVPKEAIADVEEPELEAVEITVTVDDAEDEPGNEEGEEESEEEDEGYEATPFEIQQQQTMLKHFADLKDEGAGSSSHSPLEDVEMVEATQLPASDVQAKQAVSNLKRKTRDDESDGKSIMKVKMRYGVARRKFADSKLLNWSQKYGWNLKQVEDDDEVEVEMEADEYDKEVGGQSSRKRARAVGSGKLLSSQAPAEDDDDDEEMLLKF